MEQDKSGVIYYYNLHGETYAFGEEQLGKTVFSTFDEMWKVREELNKSKTIVDRMYDDWDRVE